LAGEDATRKKKKAKLIKKTAEEQRTFFNNKNHPTHQTMLTQSISEFVERLEFDLAAQGWVRGFVRQNARDLRRLAACVVF